MNFPSQLICISMFIFLSGFQSRAMGNQCSQIFSQKQNFTDLIGKLVNKAKKTKNYEIQKFLENRNLPEAARLAKKKGQLDLSYQITQTLEKILSTDQLKKNGVTEIDDGGSEVFLVEFVSGVKAIFKPEVRYWENSEKVGYGEYLSNPTAEVYAYRLSQIFGLEFVPLTVLRTLNGKRGSLQAFVISGEKPNEESPDFIKDITELKVFDYLINNIDRPYGFEIEYLGQQNILFSGNIIWAIDHGVGLKSDPRLLYEPSKYLKKMPLKNLSLSLVQNIKATGPQILRTLLKDYPDRDFVWEIIERRYRLLAELEIQPISLK